MARRRRIRPWERRPPHKAKRHPVQRVVIGSGMAVIVWVLEKRILKGLRAKGLDEHSGQSANHDATAIRVED
jgi:hypothetical protein